MVDIKWDDMKLHTLLQSRKCKGQLCQCANKPEISWHVFHSPSSSLAAHGVLIPASVLVYTWLPLCPINSNISHRGPSLLHASCESQSELNPDLKRPFSFSRDALSCDHNSPTDTVSNHRLLVCDREKSMWAITSAFFQCLPRGVGVRREAWAVWVTADRCGLSIEFSNFSSSTFCWEFYCLQIPVLLLHCHYINSQ